MAKISVIVPVHNVENYLEKCVQSLMIQTLKDIEIILVENASTDGSLALCHQLAESDSRIKVFSLEIGDVSLARNTGIQHASSPFISFLDSDDYIAPNMYEVLYNFLVREKLELVSSNWVAVYDNRRPRYPYEESGKSYIFTKKEMLAKNFKSEIGSHVGISLYAKHLFDDIKFPVGRTYEDRATIYRIINLVDRAGYLAKAFYYYYQRGGSIIHTKSWKNYYDFAEADRARLTFIKNSDIFTEDEKPDVAQVPTDCFVRTLRHLYRLASTPEEKVLTNEMAKNIDLIPKGTKMTLKVRIIKAFAKSKFSK